MSTLDQINIIKQYCEYVEKHLRNVKASWELCITAFIREKFIWDDCIYFSINEMIKNHDSSKMSTEELVPYSNWLCGKYGVSYDIWDDGGKGEKAHAIAKSEFDAACVHHTKTNPHHWQNWSKKKYYHPYESTCHLVCMLVDWMAMGLEFGDTAEEYYNDNKTEINLREEDHKYLMRLFELLKTEANQ